MKVRAWIFIVYFAFEERKLICEYFRSEKLLTKLLLC